MKKLAFFCVLAGLFIVSCENQLLKTTGDDLPELAGNEFVFTTDRIAMGPEVHFPKDSLTDSYYVASETHTKYDIAFSADGLTLTINDTISATRTDSDTNYSKYEVTDGLFAGGRFIVWKDGNVYQAEYTLYGSGVPIVRSERGVLSKK